MVEVNGSAPKGKKAIKSKEGNKASKIEAPKKKTNNRSLNLYRDMLSQYDTDPATVEDCIHFLRLNMQVGDNLQTFHLFIITNRYLLNLLHAHYKKHGKVIKKAPQMFSHANHYFTKKIFEERSFFSTYKKTGIQLLDDFVAQIRKEKGECKIFYFVSEHLSLDMGQIMLFPNALQPINQQEEDYTAISMFGQHDNLFNQHDSHHNTHYPSSFNPVSSELMYNNTNVPSSEGDLHQELCITGQNPKKRKVYQIISETEDLLFLDCDPLEEGSSVVNDDSISFHDERFNDSISFRDELFNDDSISDDQIQNNQMQNNEELENFEDMEFLLHQF